MKFTSHLLKYEFPFTTKAVPGPLEQIIRQESNTLGVENFLKQVVFRSFVEIAAHENCFFISFSHCTRFLCKWKRNPLCWQHSCSPRYKIVPWDSLIRFH